MTENQPQQHEDEIEPKDEARETDQVKPLVEGIEEFYAKKTGEIGR